MIYHDISPNLVEALSLRWCLQWILTTNREANLLIEYDSDETVKCIKGRTQVAELEKVILDCPDIISTLSNCYIKRTKNVVARCLVGMAQQFGPHSCVGMSLNLQL